MDGQMNAMIIYKTHLEAIAKVEGINLEEVTIKKGCAMDV